MNCTVEQLRNQLPPDSIRITEVPEGCRIAISASLDLSFSRQLQKLLSAVIDCLGRDKDLTVDLEHVPYISSTGVGALSDALINARNRNINLYLAHLQPKVRAVFEILGLMAFFKERQ